MILGLKLKFTESNPRAESSVDAEVSTSVRSWSSTSNKKENAQLKIV